jgi:beta-lactamase superfamily II metal-dependent hydrolase
MKRTLGLVAVLMAVAAASPSLAQNRTTLDIYVVDVEGGNATLFVAPSGQSVLIDTGNVAPAAAKRDADRIMAAARDAGLARIDHLITTHWHADHFGGMAELAAQIPIGNYIDHGPTMQPQAASTPFLAEVYPRLVAASKRTIVKPGDTVPVAGLDWRIVSSAGDVIQTALPGVGTPNPYCASRQPRDRDQTENAQSVGFDLMCPMNRVGTVDLFIVSHHGQPVSNAEVLVHALRPRVHIMNNGTRKGGQPDAMRILHASPGLEDFWQIHFSLLSGQEYTQPGLFIANLVDEQPEAMPVAPYVAPPQNAPPAPQHNGQSYWFKVQARNDGSFTVINQRNGFSKSYAAR